ncbi:Piso0_005817 [Millerozyma farinosa CBS 7064]|uniref:Protein transport protein sec16 n=1 Tax=Pichia sorbitophila (strain ATCC MYA-4447 / BCRC 22081 / CBS 7064 / NBRC 10061 / NRRL Y-12695) TaxID=559304 RepID=G8Y012_PICSO|nr:Piso0_005817 [Millerozyma farinosa CBS 7064]
MASQDINSETHQDLNYSATHHQSSPDNQRRRSSDIQRRKSISDHRERRASMLMSEGEASFVNNQRNSSIADAISSIAHDSAMNTEDRILRGSMDGSYRSEPQRPQSGPDNEPSWEPSGSAENEFEEAIKQHKQALKDTVEGKEHEQSTESHNDENIFDSNFEEVLANDLPESRSSLEDIISRANDKQQTSFNDEAKPEAPYVTGYEDGVSPYSQAHTENDDAKLPWETPEPTGNVSIAKNEAVFTNANSSESTMHLSRSQPQSNEKSEEAQHEANMSTVNALNQDEIQNSFQGDNQDNLPMDTEKHDNIDQQTSHQIPTDEVLTESNVPSEVHDFGSEHIHTIGGENNELKVNNKLDSENIRTYPDTQEGKESDVTSQQQSSVVQDPKEAKLDEIFKEDVDQDDFFASINSKNDKAANNVSTEGIENNSQKTVTQPDTIAEQGEKAPIKDDSHAPKEPSLDFLEDDELLFDDDLEPEKNEKKPSSTSYIPHAKGPSSNLPPLHSSPAPANRFTSSPAGQSLETFSKSLDQAKKKSDAYDFPDNLLLTKIKPAARASSRYSPRDTPARLSGTKPPSVSGSLNDRQSSGSRTSIDSQTEKPDISSLHNTAENHRKNFFEDLPIPMPKPAARPARTAARPQQVNNFIPPSTHQQLQTGPPAIPFPPNAMDQPFNSGIHMQQPHPMGSAIAPPQNQSPLVAPPNVVNNAGTLPVPSQVPIGGKPVQGMQGHPQPFPALQKQQNMPVSPNVPSSNQRRLTNGATNISTDVPRSQGAHSGVSPYVPHAGPYAPSHHKRAHSRASSLVGGKGKEINPYAPVGPVPSGADQNMGPNAFLSANALPHGAAPAPPGVNDGLSPVTPMNNKFSTRRRGVSSSRHNLHPGTPIQHAPPKVQNPQALLQRQFPVFHWSSSSRVVYIIPKTNVTAYGMSKSQDVVIESIGQVMKDEALSSFPGPLSKSKTKKKDLEKWLISNGDILSQKGMNPLDSEFILNQLLLSILRHDGNTTTKQFTREVAAIFDPSLDFNYDHSAELANSFGVISNAHKLDNSGVNIIWRLLQVGETEKAIEFCTMKGDWTLALIIASMLGKDSFSKIATGYVSQTFPFQKSPGKVQHLMPLILKIFAGNIEGVVQDLYAINSERDWSIQHWNEIVSSVLINSPPRAGDFFIEFGKFMQNSGDKLISPICFVLAGLPLSSFPAANGNVLFTSIGSSAKGIIYTEIYEYLMQLSNSNVPPNGLQHLIALKLNHASLLADMGSFGEAQKYVDSLGSSLKQNEKSPFYNQSIAKEFQNLAIRVSNSGSSEQGWFSGKISKVNLDKMWGQLDKFIGGDTERPKPADNGPFSKFSPSISRVSSSIDINAGYPTSNSQYQARFDNFREPQNFYAPIMPTTPSETGSIGEPVQRRTADAFETSSVGAQNIQSHTAPSHSRISGPQYGHDMSPSRNAVGHEFPKDKPMITPRQSSTMVDGVSPSSRSKYAPRHLQATNDSLNIPSVNSLGISQTKAPEPRNLHRLKSSEHIRTDKSVPPPPRRTNSYAPSNRAPTNDYYINPTQKGGDSNIESKNDCSALGGISKPTGEAYELNRKGIDDKIDTVNTQDNFKSGSEAPQEDIKSTDFLGDVGKNELEHPDMSITGQSSQSEAKARNDDISVAAPPKAAVPAAAAVTSPPKAAVPAAAAAVTSSAVAPPKPATASPAVAPQAAAVAPVAPTVASPVPVQAPQVPSTNVPSQSTQVEAPVEASVEQSPQPAQAVISGPPPGPASGLNAPPKPSGNTRKGRNASNLYAPGARPQRLPARNRYGPPANLNKDDNRDTPKEVVSGLSGNEKKHENIESLLDKDKVTSNQIESKFDPITKPRKANIDDSFEYSPEGPDDDDNTMAQNSKAQLALNAFGNSPLQGQDRNSSFYPHNHEAPRERKFSGFGIEGGLSEFPIPGSPEVTTRANSVIGGPGGFFSSRLSQSQQTELYQQYEVQDDTVKDYVPIVNEDDEDSEDEVEKAEKARKEKEQAKQSEASKRGKEGNGHAHGKKGWRSWLSKNNDDKPKPVRAKLGTQSSFVWNEDLKRWINKDISEEEQLKPTAPPPPPASGKSLRGSNSPMPNSNLSTASGPPSMGPSGPKGPPSSNLTKAPPTISGQKSLPSLTNAGLDDLISLSGSSTVGTTARSKRGARRGYVNVLDQK